MLCLLCYVCLVRRLVEFVAATTELMDTVILEAQLGIGAKTEIRIETESLIVQLWQLCISISIIVITLTSASLPISINTRLVVIGHQRDIARRHVIERVSAAHRHKGMSEGSRIANRLLGDDVDGAADGRRTEEGRASTTNHFHSVYHIGRNLFQAIHAVEGREHGARIDQYLRVVPVETVDAHLREAAVLAVVFRAHTGLEVEPLRQASGLRDVEKLTADHVHQVGGHSSRCLVSVGRHHHLVEGHIIGGQGEVELLGGVMADGDGLLHRLVAHHLHNDRKSALWQVLQEVVPCLVRRCDDGGALEQDGHVGQVLATAFVYHMAIHIGVRALLGTHRGRVIAYQLVVLDLGCLGRK